MSARRFGLALVALGAAALAWWSWPARRPLQPGTARRALDRPGAEAWDIELVRGGVRVGRMISVHLDARASRPRLVLNEERKPLRALEPEADLVANAGFFTPEFRPTGLLVSEGRVLHPFVDHGGGAGTGVLVWRDDGSIRLHAREAFSLQEPQAIRIALQAGPRLIEPEGEPGIRADDRVGAHRTVVGRDRGGRFVIAVAHGFGASRSGPSLWEMMRLLGPEGIGDVRADLALDLALNLDGGPSTGLHLRPAEVALAAGEIVPSALVVELPP